MTIHDLPHTAESLAVAAGATVKAVQKMLEHASASTSLDVYTDPFDDDLDAVAHRLDVAAMRSDVVKRRLWSLDQAALGPRDPHDSGLVGRTGLEPATEGL
ncbi:MAG TPA: hypothetical protein VIG76_13450 [Amnibacterium sp.]|uniref:hypothetical protein n=1 Tax=Amnibacterium sp. TaxID=1872496 RepID=UPI002F9233FF